MNNITFKQLPQITGGELVQGHYNDEIHDLITDSRKANPNKNSIFFAIDGLHNDGHRFIAELYKMGCRQFIIEKKVDLGPFQDANFLFVPSSLLALQSLVSKKRKEFSIPVIAITGSNGKTIVKEWLFQLLSPDFKIVKNPASYNSQLGVPLSVWQMDSSHQLGIFEAGISKPGEMERLERIINPSIGIFTNVLMAHDEGFESRERKAIEKARLFRNANVVVYCKDNEVIDRVLNNRISINQKLFSWGVAENADVRVIKLNQQSFQVHYQSNSIVEY